MILNRLSRISKIALYSIFIFPEAAEWLRHICRVVHIITIDIALKTSPKITKNRKLCLQNSQTKSQRRVSMYLFPTLINKVVLDITAATLITTRDLFHSVLRYTREAHATAILKFTKSRYYLIPEIKSRNQILPHKITY